MDIRIAKFAFDASVGSSEKLILDAMTLYRDGHLEESQQFDIAELGFLKVAIAWEELLRSSFIGYMIGDPDLQGNVAPCYVRPRDSGHAEEIILEGRSYSEWNSREYVQRIAMSMFEDGWHVVSGLDSPAISHVKLLRNRIAHRSSSTETGYRGVVRTLHGTVPEPLWPPGKFLTEKKNRNSPRYYKVLIRQIQACAKKLVNE